LAGELVQVHGHDLVPADGGADEDHRVLRPGDDIDSLLPQLRPHGSDVDVLDAAADGDRVELRFLTAHRDLGQDTRHPNQPPDGHRPTGDLRHLFLEEAHDQRRVDTGYQRHPFGCPRLRSLDHDGDRLASRQPLLGELGEGRHDRSASVGLEDDGPPLTFGHRGPEEPKTRGKLVTFGSVS
jgi:hypothetical protein